MEPWRVNRPVVTDYHHFEEELDPDQEPHNTEKLIRIRIEVRSWIWIQIRI
jgi:hypothetical protein